MQTHIHLDHLADIGLDSLEHGHNVLADLLRLLCCSAWDDIPLRVDGDVAREERKTSGLDGMRLPNVRVSNSCHR